MLTPTNVTLAQMNTAILAGNRTHMRLVFPVQNITLTDDDISADGGLVINALMNPDTDLVMGKAVASEVVVRLLNGSVFTGFDWTEEFHVDFGVEIGNSTEWVTLGYFTGKKPKRTVRVDTIEFSAIDRMQKFNELADDFIAGLTFPLSVEDIFQALCTYAGVSYVSGDEIADVMAMEYSDNPFNNGITCRDILSYIAEANCCYAKITAGGNVKLSWFSDQTANYTLTMNDHFGLDIDEEASPAIDSVRICSSDDSISPMIYPISGNNVIYDIIDNPLLLLLGTADRTTALTDILARLSAFGAYTPASVNAVGNPMVETGDIIDVEYDGNQSMNLPIFVRGFGWNGASGDVYECTGTIDREMTPATREQYAEGGKLSNKYSIVSGIDINDEGVTISGNKYLKFRSGSSIDMQSGTFDLMSDNLDVRSYGLLALKEKITAGNDYVNYTHAIGKVLVGALNDVVGEEDIAPQSSGNLSKGHYIIYRLNDFKSVPGKQFTSALKLGTKEINGEIVPIIFGSCVVKENGNETSRTNGNLYFDSIDLDTIVRSPSYGGTGVVNNLTETAAGKVLDARQGKALNDKISNFIYGGSLPNNTNLNTAITPGFYQLPSANTYTNVPSDGGTISILLVIRTSTSANTVTQFGFSMDGLYYRFRVDASTWSYWRKASTSILPQ